MSLPSNRTARRKRPGLLGIKALIFTFSGAITIGFWYLLSNNAFVATTPPAAVALSAQPPANVAQDPPPLPTIVPLLQVSTSQSGFETKPISAPQTAAVSQAIPLRVVTAPSIVVVQKFKPVIGDQPAAPARTSSGAGGGGGGGGGHKGSKKPTTRSSK